MKLQIPCIKCMSTDLIYPRVDPLVEIRDDGLYKVVCHVGHKTIVALQEQKFEILFEIGANAIIDGYYREAVSSFAASLERFYEFYANVIFIKFNISKSVYEKTSDLMSRYSERQLGAFVALYALENKTAPILLNTKNVEFRNRVIHRGTIPTKEEAINYGSVVLDTIRPVLSSLKKNYKKEIGETIFRHKDEIQKKSEGAKNIATLVFPTIISLASSDKERDAKPLKEIIQEMEKKKQKS